MKFVIWYSIDGGKRCLRKYFYSYKAAEIKLVNTLKRDCYYSYIGTFNGKILKVKKALFAELCLLQEIF